MKALVFMQLKNEVDRYVAQYSENDLPPPCQLFTLANGAGSGDLHVVQKVFEGAFEVCVMSNFSVGNFMVLIVI
jgi:mannosyl-oligosaccharide glucosidase